MSIRVALNHKTSYSFDRPVKLSAHVIRLRPAPHSRTPIKSYSLNIEPEEHFINWQQDPFGNYLARIVFPEKTRKLSIDVDLVAEMTVINPFDFFLEEYAETFPFEYEASIKKDLTPYLEITENGDRLLQWLKKVDKTPTRTTDFLVKLNQQLHDDLDYTLRMEPGVQTCEETLELGRGSCRDYAWLLVQICRHLGLAARFVSGYLVQLTADVKSLDGPSGPEEDFTDLHAWTEIYIPGAGWVGLDATSGLFAGEGHIPLACTPHPQTAAAITGASDPCEVEFYYHNRVTRIHEDPRVTKPYTDQQWESILALGDQVDKELTAQDVRLTMGGEPTFVSIDDMEGDQWNTHALGPEKRQLAGELWLKLRDHFAPGGLLHHGQGKWYPGEPLPRWALSLFWRKDGKPIWKNPDLLADESQSEDLTPQRAKEFLTTLCDQVKINQKFLIPAFEDKFYYLWQEGNLPENTEVEENKLDSKLDREKLREVFERGLDAEVGYVLPLKYDHQAESWISCPWPLRRSQLFLLPGNSPVGLRLPLGSLPWVAPEDQEPPTPRDPFDTHPPLPEIDVSDDTTQEEPQTTASDEQPIRYVDIFHTAMCAEVRDGKLYLFLPPLDLLEDYLKLIHAIEKTAKKLKQKVVIEGYPPPQDFRMNMLQVTPDPGVIEVNIHPANSWRELVENTQELYEMARLNRLGTEKFMIDGRHTGTGGGNHVTIGGPSPTDSPMLRRPDLLRSLITYWQNHPGLSFLFSGAFIGPTSQSPRVDEARDDTLYELEIAFQQLPKGDVPEPWRVDRTLRNLLIDMTGNTHRTEFCIDKLYSPDGPNGRRGLVELRAFEMPPHSQMSLAQTLLLRTLIARFWKTPYENKLIRWGTSLHDRFMLPHFVWQDIKDVVADIQRAGYPMKLEWFAPFLEFRFPHYGRITSHGVTLDLSWAIEPWHVLGEEMSGQGTSRYVDSSVERLQIKATGLVSDRYCVTCNGRRIPLQRTDTRGEYVAGVRFKAWNPFSSLHPSIQAEQKLVFDIVDLANNRSIGGCTYHVSHPGGRNYDTFPVNANEAESRRNARFWEHGHSQGETIIAPEEPAGDHPYTLDLRYRASQA